MFGNNIYFNTLQGDKQVTLLNAVVYIYSSAISNNCTTKLINDTTDARLYKK